MASTLRADVLVIGGGLVGCSAAYECAKRGLSVVVAERGEVGRAASWAAAGILTPIHLADYPAALVDLCAAAQANYEPWAAEVRAESGIDPEFRREGMLVVATEEAEVAELAKLHAWKLDHGQPFEALDAKGAARVEPLVSPSVRRALLLPDVAQVRNNRLVRAVAAAATRRKVVVLERTEVVDLLLDGRQVVGARTTDGPVRAAWTVLAAGAWSRPIAERVGLDVRVEPVRGQMLLTEVPGARLSRMVLCGEQYLVPRADGRVLVGSTTERVGFDASVTFDGVRLLAERAARMVPALAGAPLRASWAGLRPGSPDRIPYLGPVSDLPGLLLACGHFRNGILLGPISGRLIAQAIAGERTDVPLDPYRLSR